MNLIIAIEGLVANMKQRTITALLLILGVIPLFFSVEYMHLVIIMIAFITSLELNDLISDDKYPLIIALNFAMIVSIGLDFVASTDKIIVLGIFLLLFVMLDLIYNEIGFNNLSLIYTVSILIGFALNSFVTLYNADKWFIWYILLVNYGSDTAAYLIGSKFGKHKLIPKISPNKTIEGSIAGIIFGGLLGTLFLYFYGSGEYLIISVVVSCLIPVISQVGDLFFSSLKRSFNKKDFGGLIPGHGGVLDRIDSLIFSLVFVIIFIRLGFIGIIL